MESKTIKEFEVGSKIEGFFIIKTLDIKLSSNGNRYMDFSLGDRTGDITGKLWECTEEDMERFKGGMLIKVRAVVSEWQGNLQLKIDRIRATMPDDNVNPSEFVPVAPYDPELMFNIILHFIEVIRNKDIKNITSMIINDNKKSLSFYPAAKSNHHSIRSGLLYHITTMLKLAEKIIEVYPYLNSDLLYAGVILHDIAKLYEMDATELGIVTDYTVEGQLLGHIIQGINMVEKASEKVGADKEVTMLLEHMILSHHYEAEFGSPKKPMFPEGEILHHLDMMDARMFDMRKALEGTEEGLFTDRIRSMDGRKVYKTSIKSEK